MSAPPILLRGDARRLPLADASVDLVVTSPPYFSQRSYQDGGVHYDGQIGDEPTPGEYIDSLIACTREMVRVLKPSGSIFLNLGDKYDSATNGGPSSSPLLHSGPEKVLPYRGRRHRVFGRKKSLMLLPERFRIRCVDELGVIARQVLIWSKPNGLPEGVTDRTRRSHEDWVHLTVRSRYFADLDELRDTPSGYSRPNSATRGGRGGQKPREMTNTCNPRGRLPGSVWTVPIQPLRVPAELDTDHYAAYPMEWPRRLITGWCPPAGVVLDPFGGTGTTAMVAAALDRVGISVEKSADYNRIAQWRISDPRQRAKAADLPPPTAARQHVHGEPDLFTVDGEAG